VATELALSLKIPGIRPLAAARHRNKLKRGHLAGNRFTVTVRGVAGDAFDHAEAVLSTLTHRGVPNIFGPQRYGIQGNSHLIGRALIAGNHRGAIDALIGSSETVGNERWKEAIEAYRRNELQESIRLFPAACRIEREILQRLAERPDRPAQALHAVPPRLKSLYLSAWQSELFDRLLLDRINTIDRVESGDLAWKHANGASFLVEDAAVECVRAASFEISATGPLFGSRMTWPAGEVRCREESMLAQERLAADITAIAWPPHLEGARRPYRVPLSDCETTAGADFLTLGFSLPKGSYATAVLREVMKDW
jgi:tRNA pseudouridine13 synthase